MDAIEANRSLNPSEYDREGAKDAKENAKKKMNSFVSSFASFAPSWLRFN
jgi:hypothetical protein